MFAFIINGNSSSGGGGSGATYYYTISSDTDGVNLWNAIVADNGGTAPTEGNIQVTIASGVTIGAVDNTNPQNYAINVTTDFGSNSKNLTIINNGYIGGFGGKGGQYDEFLPTSGQNGGCGINFRSDATLINNGTVAGGGGGGGGSNGTTSEPGGYTYYGDGGGGAGLPAGIAGGGYSVGPLTEGASDGTQTTGGLATLGIAEDEPRGGNGGNRGQSGGNAFLGESGGNAGPPYQVIGCTVTVENSGDIYGTPLI